jgi:hypothetical protein
VKGSGHGLILRYYPGICLEGLRKITKNLSQDNQCQGTDMNPGPSEHEVGVSTTRRHSVSSSQNANKIGQMLYLPKHTIPEILKHVLYEHLCHENLITEMVCD